MQEIEGSFENLQGIKLACTLHISKEGNPCIVIMHGLKSDKHNKSNWANYLCEAGYNVLRFDFTGHGNSEGELNNITLTGLVDDAKSAINFICSEMKSDTVGLTGHSLGGAVSIIASEDSRVKASCPISAPIDFSSRSIGIDSFDSDSKKYDMISIIKNLEIPMLFIHGNVDEIVPLNNSEVAVKNAKNAKLKVLDGVGHLFDKLEDYQKMIKINKQWFIENLKV